MSTHPRHGGAAYPGSVNKLRIALCQLSTVVGDFDGVTEAVLEALVQVERAGCDLAVFPRAVIGGSPIGDLVSNSDFLAAHDRTLAAIAAASGDCVVTIGGIHGSPHPVDAVFVCAGGEIRGVHRGSSVPLGSSVPERDDWAFYEIAGVRVAVVSGTEPLPGEMPMGVDVVVLPDASEFRPDRHLQRQNELESQAMAGGAAIAYVNRVGAGDGLVFDGGSTLFGTDGSPVAAAERFEPGIVIVDLDVPARTGSETNADSAEKGVRVGREKHADSRPTISQHALPERLSPEAELWHALVTGLRCYMTANGFGDLTLGVSGGVDSALVAAIAVDAAGADHVHGVAMPSRYSSDHSVADAEELASNLGIDLRRIPIEPAHRAFADMLATTSIDLRGDVTEQNVQARIRGVLLMALSNAFGWLVVACGNKSEAAVGYSTLYGDGVGALSVIGDVLKTDVYALCRWRNRVAGRLLIPESILTKAPSAELAPGQRDDESLPPYPTLDPILRDHVETGLGIDALIAAGHPAAAVRQVVAMVGRAEYKRRQTPLPIVVTSRAFGEDRRVPVTNAFLG